MNKTRNFNFGKIGWMLIIICIITYFFSVIEGVGGSVIIPKFSEMYGWSISQLNSYMARVGLVSAIACILISVVVSRGLSWKVLFIVSMIIAIVGVILWGTTKSTTQYFIGASLISIGLTGAVMYAMPMMISNWFPKKKGTIMGIITIGQNIGTMSITWVFTLLWQVAGFAFAFFVVAIVMFIPILLLLIFVKEKPEMQGCLPDNEEVDKTINLEEMTKRNKVIAATEKFTIIDYLKQKQFWAIILSNGILAMLVGGVNTYSITVAMENGRELYTAMTMLTVSAIIAMPASVALGIYDTKKGTRKASIVVGIVAVISMLMTTMKGNNIVALIFIIFFGIFSGTINNIRSSKMISVYGRYDFTKALAVFQPIYTFVRMLGPTVIAKIREISPFYAFTGIILTMFALTGAIIYALSSDRCIGRTDEDIEKALLKE